MSTVSLVSAYGGMTLRMCLLSIKCHFYPAVRWRGRIVVVSRVRVVGTKVHDLVAISGRHHAESFEFCPGDSEFLVLVLVWYCLQCLDA